MNDLVSATKEMFCDDKTHTMYDKDKRTRITVRLTEKQFVYVKTSADMYGVSPAEFVRMAINAMIFTNEKFKERQAEKEGVGRGNDETNKCDNV